jgi:hypothetical protein
MAIAFIHSKKAFLATALLVVVVLCSVAVAYAAATVGSVAPLKGTVMYSLDNAQAGTWSTTLAPNCPTAPWYSRLEINSAGYKGPVTVTWKLQQETGFSSWTDVSEMSTTMVLSGSVQSIYATNNGVYSQSNYNWGQNVTTSGTYRIVATLTA